MSLMGVITTLSTVALRNSSQSSAGTSLSQEQAPTDVKSNKILNIYSDCTSSADYSTRSCDVTYTDEFGSQYCSDSSYNDWSTGDSEYLETCNDDLGNYNSKSLGSKSFLTLLVV